MQPSHCFFKSHDGLRLHAAVYGDVAGPPVVCLPGLTRNTRDFHQLAMYLAYEAPTPRRVIAIDYRGRGQSDYDQNWKNYDLLVEARDVLTVLDAMDVPTAAVIGTSRGGLIGMILPALRPGLMQALVLNDIGPVIEAEGLAAIRTYLDQAPASQSFDEALATQIRVHGPSFGALAHDDWERMVKAIYRQSADGRLAPDYDRNLLKTMEASDPSKPLPTLWPQFEALGAIPLLVIRGENSSLLSAETVSEMQNRHPALQVVIASGQGHAPMLETGTLAQAIAAFLDTALKLEE